MGDNRSRVWPRECKVCGRMIHKTNFMYRSAITLVGNLVRSDTHEIKCKKWKDLPRSEERFAGRMFNAERISYYYGAPGKPLVCVTCGSKELVLALPPQCVTCLKRASVVETLKRLPMLNGPEVREVMEIIEEAFSAPPHEPSVGLC